MADVGRPNAGRGFGKTRTGGGWVHERAMTVDKRWIALVAKTPADARDVMIEGPGGILRNAPPSERPVYEPSKRRVTWPNESWATVYSAQEADQLRGYSGDTAWLDEFAKYSNPREVWDNLQFGMREASIDQPRVCITTTPRPLPILEEIEERKTTVTVTGLEL
jgi:phage terminase large subunit-like protein